MAAKPGSRPTMRDVAASASVSIQTVSNVVNGRYDQLQDQTRARVEKAMKQLEYRPNSTARGLRSSRSRTFGFLLLDESTSYLADPLTSQLIAGVGDVTRDNAYSLLIQADRPSASEPRLLAPVQESRVDGCVTLLTGPKRGRRSYLRRLRDLGVEHVALDEVIRDRRHLSVRTNDRERAGDLTRHLRRRGHERIAFIAIGSPWANVEQRHLGYLDVLEDEGLDADPELQLFEAPDWQSHGGQAMAEKLLDLPDAPTAIMCGSDLVALGAIRALRERGIAIPDEVAVTGFDDFEFSSVVDPAITTVRVPAYEQGRVAAELLLERLNGREPEQTHIVLDDEVILRESA